MKKIIIIFLLCLTCMPRAYAKPNIYAEVAYGESLHLYLDGLKNALSLEPDKIGVQTDENEVIITPFNLGTATVIVWTTEGKILVVVNTYMPKPKPNEQVVMSKFKKYYDTHFILELNSSFDTRTSSNGYTYKNWRSFEKIEGPTYFGRLGIQATTKFFPEKDALQSWTAYLLDGKFGSIKHIDIYAGNVISSSVGPMYGIGLKGVALEQVLSDDLAYKIATGRIDSLNIGNVYDAYYRSERDEIEDINITSASVEYKQHFLNSLIKHAIGIRMSDDSEYQTSFYQLSVKKGKFDFELGIKEFTELVKVSLEYTDTIRKWNIQTKAFSNEYLKDSGYSQIGERGIQMNVNRILISRKKQLVDSILLSSAITQRYAPRTDVDDWTDFGVRYSVNLRGFFKFLNYSLNFRGYHYPEEVSTANYDQIRASSTKSINLIGKKKVQVSGNVYYRKIYNNYDKNSAGGGLNLHTRMGKNTYVFASYNTSKTAHRNRKDTTIHTVNIGMSRNSRFKNGIRMNNRFQYLTSIYKSYYKTTKRNYISFQSRIDYSTVKFPGKFYLSGEIRKYLSEDYSEYLIRIGYNMKVALFPGIMPKCVLEGYVFKDLNNNKIFDDGDIPISDAPIYVNKEKITKTDSEGYFKTEYRGISAQVNVGSDVIPKGYTYSTQGLYKYTVENGKKYTSYFGFTLNNQIWGKCYEDANNNGKHDDGERVFANVEVSIKNKNMKTITDNYGIYRFSPLEPGDYIVELNFLTLPYGFKSITPIRTTVHINEGETKEVSFRLQKLPVKKIETINLQ